MLYYPVVGFLGRVSHVPHMAQHDGQELGAGVRFSDRSHVHA
jgi:hypothetical protein